MKKPTIEQIQECIDDRGYLLDAEQFFYHYEAVGWMIGRNKMKDWKCALTTWFIRGGKKKAMQAPNSKIPQYEARMGTWLRSMKTLGDIENNASFVTLLSDPDMRKWAEKVNPLVKEVL